MTAELDKRYENGKQLTEMTGRISIGTEADDMKDAAFYNLVKNKIIPEYNWDELDGNFQVVLDVMNFLFEKTKEEFIKVILDETGNVYDYLITNIPDEKDVIFDFSKIPPNNLIAKYIKYCCSIQDAYPEYHFANILTLLGYIAPARQHPSFGYVYNNTWVVALGIAGFSGKTTTTDPIRNDLIPFLNKIRLVKRLTSKPTPEALITDMKDGDNNKQYWLVDEAVGIMKFISRDYASELEELLLQIYSHTEISRSTKKDGPCIVNNPHVPMLWFTTIDNFVSKAKKDKYESGFLQRPMYFLPRRVKEIKEDKPVTIDQIGMLTDVKTHIINLYSFITEGYIEFGENEILNKWKHEQRLKIHTINGDVKRGARTRSYEHVRKIAMLLTIGSQEFLDNLKMTKNNKKTEGQAALHNFIPDWAALLAIEYVENFMENFDRIYKLSITDNGSNIATIIKMLSESEDCTRTELSSAVNKHGKQFDDIMIDLIDDNIVEKKERADNKNRIRYVYKLIKYGQTSNQPQNRNREIVQ